MRSNDRARRRGDRLLPCVLHRPSPARHGGCRATPAINRVQTKTATPSLVQLRPSVLGGAPPFVAELGERPHHREIRDCRVLAPCWISAILATAIPSSTPWPAEGQPGGSAADSAHEVRQSILGC